jgi:hypothetical protein|uniref:Uncharacterized protein n=1 Tax=Mus musculus TaxID=10090 RepID=Q8C4V6_MOUSE|nr:unnamed protein product [Mus musculus]
MAAQPHLLSLQPSQGHLISCSAGAAPYKAVQGGNTSFPIPPAPSSPTEMVPQQNQAAVRKDFPPESMGRMQGKGKNTHQSLSSTSSGLEIPPILKLEMSASKAPAPKKSDISTALCSVPPLPSPRSRGK